MKRRYFFLFLLFLPFLYLRSQAQSWIRINQMGYLPGSLKTAVLLSKEEKVRPKEFELHDALTGEAVFSSGNARSYGEYAAFQNTFRLDFSEFKTPGAYYLSYGKIKSPVFRIGYDVYEGSADFLLKYMRQQRCGYNPYLKDSCHVQDGYIIYHPTLDSTHINVTGGWHDASDYLQYVATSANAVFQMLLAYEHHPEAFADAFDASGNPGSNGIPDILDEAKWGLDWLVRMNPAPDMMFNQIADDRDHAGFRLPTEDTTSYGKGLERPVYFVNGKPQGLYKYQNRTTGVSSTAGKYASAFALGAAVLKEHYPRFSDRIAQKASDAFTFGLSDTGACQTAPCGAPYFYEEDNWTDDMELAAAQLFRLTGKQEYLAQAVKFGNGEAITPWMGADTARHYQWYPFFNAGHFFLAKQQSSKEASRQFTSYYRDGLKAVSERGKGNPFLNGIPFIWCSNNLTTALLSQSALYRKASGDSTFNTMEASLRDWLFGCNPWGTGMIVGLPAGGDTPVNPHSSFTVLRDYPIDGGLVDGPVYGSIFNNLKGIRLAGGDEYAAFQSDLVVYHDDYGDYSTNEPTMDGTACLTYYLSGLEAKGRKNNPLKNTDKTLGAITRMDSTQKNVYLIFSAHEFDEGGTIIRESLEKNNVPASFFFTGDFYRKGRNRKLIRKLLEAGHYLGPHSGNHLLYASWEHRDSTLISRETFLDDLRDNYRAMEKHGIDKADAMFLLPPYEWYNLEIAEWSKDAGLQLLNFTAGTGTARDYTWPGQGEKYTSSETIFNDLLELESDSGLNGYILLVHLGTDPRRKDKFYSKLDELINTLKDKGYHFKRFGKNDD